MQKLVEEFLAKQDISQELRVYKDIGEIVVCVGDKVCFFRDNTYNPVYWYLNSNSTWQKGEFLFGDNEEVRKAVALFGKEEW